MRACVVACRIVPCVCLSVWCQVVVDRATIERHLLTSATDPFSRSELRVDMLKPATEVKAKIDAWLGGGSSSRQHEAAGGGGQ